MLEKFLKGTYSFERQLGKNIVFSKDEIAIIHGIVKIMVE